MVKIEIISPGAAATILRNGERVPVLLKQLITYDEADTLEVTGGSITYSVNESEVFTKSGDSAPTVPQAAAKPELPVATETPPLVIKQPKSKTATKAK
jgi:hypothetical protein